MRRPLLITTSLAVLALPGTALAGPVKINPAEAPVSSDGVMTVEVANSGPSVLRGKAIVSAGKRQVASKRVRLGKRSVSTIAIRLSDQARSALDATRGRAGFALKLRRAGGRKVTARRTLFLTGSSEPAADPQPGVPAAPAAPSGPARYVGRLGDEGGNDELEMTVDGNQLTFAKQATVPVVCGENGGAYRSSISLEMFDAPGPWTIGEDGSVQKQGIAVNTLVYSGMKTITYKVTETKQEAGKITGKLGISFSDSKLDIFSNKITFINCFGSETFEAVPA